MKINGVPIRDLSGEPYKSHREHHSAKARLRDAAPELLGALKTIVRQMEGGHPVGHDAFLAARRAISNAEPLK
jgi:hypothetical protein